MELHEWILDELGQNIWEKKYRHKEESLDDWFRRVSGGDEELEKLIRDKKFLFGGRILANRGLQHERKLTYSNCYVLSPPEDSIEGIYSTASKLARTFSYGGGVGIDISQLRPKGSPVNNAAITTSGAVSFMDTFSRVSETIGQHGRRGALMISMDCNHPDIGDFIDAKRNTEALNGCNISVRVDDKFMRNVVNGNPHEAELFRRLCENNWNYAEPGILYWSRIEENNLLDKFEDFKYAGVNPCAEEPLPAGGSCLLGALNLSEFVANEDTNNPAFDSPEFRKSVRISVRALNEVLDEGLDLHPLKEQRETVRDWRQIGLGIMGFADLLIKLKIPYGSERCLNLIDTIGKNLVSSGLRESCRLARDIEPFSKCDNQGIINSNYIQNLDLPKFLIQEIQEHGLRNSQIFTIAPTGSISTMLGISGGLEPIYDYTYTRETKSLHDQSTTYEVITPIIEEALKKEGINLSEENPRPLPNYICCAKTINPLDRISVQGAWQNYIDASISSTVNLSEDVTVEDVENLYIMAWENRCKGLTIFRDGCDREGILKSNTDKKGEPTEETSIGLENDDYDMSNCVAVGTKIQTGCGSLWITVYFHKVTHKLCHIFLNKGSTGGCNSFMVGLSRMISLAGKKGATLDEIVDQLNSVVSCPTYIVVKKTKQTSEGTSCPSAIGKALYGLYDEFIKMTVSPTKEVIEDKSIPQGTKCPECGVSVNFSGGCNICTNCGYSKCD